MFHSIEETFDDFSPLGKPIYRPLWYNITQRGVWIRKLWTGQHCDAELENLVFFYLLLIARSHAVMCCDPPSWFSFRHHRMNCPSSAILFLLFEYKCFLERTQHTCSYPPSCFICSAPWVKVYPMSRAHYLCSYPPSCFICSAPRVKVYPMSRAHHMCVLIRHLVSSVQLPSWRCTLMNSAHHTCSYPPSCFICSAPRVKVYPMSRVHTHVFLSAILFYLFSSLGEGVPYEYTTCVLICHLVLSVQLPGWRCTLWAEHTTRVFLSAILFYLFSSLGEDVP